MNVQDLSYPRPLVTRQMLGGTPRDRFDHDPKPGESFVSCSEGQCANLPQQVWRDQPVLDDQGQPKMETVEETVDLSPYSPTLRALGFGFLGGFAGTVLGLMGGLITGHPGLGLAVGASSGAILAGGLGAASAVGDRATLVWEPHDVVQQRYLGYTESVEPGQLHGQDGYFHRYQPQLEATVVGHYQTPRVVHSKESQ